LEEETRIIDGDLDCGDIPQKRFTVLQPDPHRFDGDKDGVGCES
jgi:micrococcal nuclease